MTTQRPVKVIKNDAGKEPEIPAEESAADSIKWSKEVRSWVVETQQNRQVVSLQTFDSLFKADSPETEQGIELSLTTVPEKKSKG